jgi:uncharacterized protein (TIRG00374 family)
MLKLAFGVATLSLVVYLAWSPELIAAIGGVSLLEYSYFFLISLGLIGISALKWQFFLWRIAGKLISLIYLSKLYVIGYFVNGILPSYIGGDAVRSYKIGRELGQINSAAATILERYTGSLALLLIGSISSLVSVEIPLVYRGLMFLLLLGLCLVTMVAMFAPLKWLLSLHPKMGAVVENLKKLREALRFGMTHPRIIIIAMLLSFMFHGLAVVNTAVAGKMIGWEEPSLILIASVLPFMLIMGALPLTPSGLGLQEGAFFFFLQIVGASPAQAAGVALLLRSKAILLALIGWILWLKDGSK